MGKSKAVDVSYINSCLLKSEINQLIIDKKLFIRPLLEETQIGEIGIDLRLGYDFLKKNYLIIWILLALLNLFFFIYQWKIFIY